MTEWISLNSAIERIRDARKIGEGAAIRFLIDACAEDVRSRQYECGIPLQVAEERQKAESQGQSFQPPDLSYLMPTIPAAVWRGAHLEMNTGGELYPAGTDPISNPATEHGGYGYGGSGVIEINADDLREHLRKPLPQKRGRKPKVNEKAKQQVFALLNYHGLPNDNDPEWKNQAAVEKAIEEIAGVSPSTAREHAPRIIAEWQARKGR